MTVMYAILLLAIPPLGLLPIFPAFWVFDRIDDLIGTADFDRTLYMLSIPIMAWPTAFVMVLVTVGFIAACRWIILPRVREGTYSVHSWFYFRKWAVALATEVTLETLSSLFATVYMRTWYRLMGAKIGKDAEISTNLSGRYDLVEIGEKCFIADEVILGDEEIRNGWMYLKRVKTGPRVFVGNSAVVPAGADIPGRRADRHQVEAARQPSDACRATPGSDRRRSSCRSARPSMAAAPTGPMKRRAGRNSRAPASRRSRFPCRPCCSSPLAPGRWNGSARRVLEGAYFEVVWQFMFASVAICLAMTLVVVALEMDHHGPLRADDEADVVLVGDADRGGCRHLLGPGRQGLARPFARHAFPALAHAAASARNSDAASMWT